MQEVITLKKKERYYLNEKFYLIKKGKLISKNVLKTGKVLANENFLSEGEFVGNFFDFLPKGTFTFPEFGIEVEAVQEPTILEEFNFSHLDLFKNEHLETLIIQLIKKTMIKFFYQLYDKRGYILAVLKLYADKEGKILKKEISHENFNISRSQFFLIYSGLKKEKFFSEKDKIIYLDLEKINTYLEEHCS